MAETKCTGNCMACTILQRQYCASQLAYSNMRMLEGMQQAVTTLQEDMKKTREKIEAMQTGEASIFNPTVKEPTAPAVNVLAKPVGNG